MVVSQEIVPERPGMFQNRGPILQARMQVSHKNALYMSAPQVYLEILTSTLSWHHHHCASSSSSSLPCVISYCALFYLFFLIIQRCWQLQVALAFQDFTSFRAVTGTFGHTILPVEFEQHMQKGYIISEYTNVEYRLAARPKVCKQLKEKRCGAPQIWSFHHRKTNCRQACCGLLKFRVQAAEGTPGEALWLCKSHKECWRELSKFYDEQWNLVVSMQVQWNQDVTALISEGQEYQHWQGKKHRPRIAHRPWPLCGANRNNKKWRRPWNHVVTRTCQHHKSLRLLGPRTWHGRKLNLPSAEPLDAFSDASGQVWIDWMRASQQMFKASFGQGYSFCLSSSWDNSSRSSLSSFLWTARIYWATDQSSTWGCLGPG